MKRDLLKWTLILCATVASAPLVAETTAPADAGITLAQATKKKKRKVRRSRDDVSFGPEGISAIDDNDTGVGVHRAQEGVDAPYFAEVTLLTDISLLSTAVDDSEDPPVQNANYSVTLQPLFILGMFEIGPDFAFRRESVATGSTSVNEDNETVVTTLETSTTEYSIGGLFKLNLGDIDHDTTVFFGYGGVSYRAGQVKVGENDPSESSGLLVKAGGGMNVFMDSNVAFNPRVEFRYSTDKDESDKDAPGRTTTGLVVLVGIGVFI